MYLVLAAAVYLLIGLYFAGLMYLIDPEEKKTMLSVLFGWGVFFLIRDRPAR